jgi:uridine kinase
MRPYLVGIAGGTASGKTTIAHKLVEIAGTNQADIVELDRYYRSQDHVDLTTRHSVNYDHPDALEFELLILHLKSLRYGEAVDTPIYDFATHTRLKGQTIRVEPKPIIFFEGILTLCVRELRELFDTTIFVDAPDDIRLTRRIERDIRERGRTRESAIEQWNATVQPMYQQFCEPSRAFAEMGLDGTRFNDDQLRTLLDELIKRASPEAVLA